MPSIRCAQCAIANGFIIGYKSFNLLFKRKNGLIDEIKKLGLTGECRTINLIVVGLMGSGKSSFVNTLKTVARNSGEIATLSIVHPKYHSSTTKKVCLS